MSDAYTPPSNVVSRAGAGVVGGLAGGLLLGVALQAMGDVMDFAQMVGGKTYSVAWTVLLSFCAFAGGLFGVLFGRWISRQLVSAIGIGLIYGGLWGALVALMVVPLLLSRTMFAFEANMPILGAYVLFGVATGVVYAIAGPRRRYWYYPRRGALALVTTVSRRRRRRDDDDEED
ncbi:MAG TPA: hypothetical protein VFC00_32970 [Micromonosporaceae bacterium]|nr:hypothetical protein [Micromonosporaceae bacterium]